MVQSTTLEVLYFVLTCNSIYRNRLMYRHLMCCIVMYRDVFYVSFDVSNHTPTGQGRESIKVDVLSVSIIFNNESTLMN